MELLNQPLSFMQQYEDAWINFYRSVSKTIEKYSQLANTATMISIERDIESTETNSGEWERQIKETIDCLKNTLKDCCVLFSKPAPENDGDQADTSMDTSRQLSNNKSSIEMIEDAKNSLSIVLLPSGSIVLSTLTSPANALPPTQLQAAIQAAANRDQMANRTSNPSPTTPSSAATSSAALPISASSSPSGQESTASVDNSAPPKPSAAKIVTPASQPVKAKAKAATSKDQDTIVPEDGSSTTATAAEHAPKAAAKQQAQEANPPNSPKSQLRRRS